MSLCTSNATHFPARLAYTAAGIFFAASLTTNVSYGWGRGSDLASSIVWAGVAGAAALLAAIAWPAVIRARSFPAAAMAFVALILATSYSTVAALGSASGSRMIAAASEAATTDNRQRAQDAYTSAKAELAKVAPARSVGEVEALLAAARPVCKVVVAGASRQTVCGKPAALEAELARARQRERLQQAVDTAAATLAAAPARPANSDARALARYLSAFGADISTERLNDLLVVLAILLVEMGPGLSLATALALSGRPAAEQTAQNAATAAAVGQPAVDPLAARSPVVAPVTGPPTARQRPVTGLPEAVVAWLSANGGRAGSVRVLADAVGRPASTTADACRRLASEQRVRLTRGAGGRTAVELAPARGLN